MDTGRNRLGHHLEIPVRACCRGDDSVGEFYSIAVTNGAQQADTGTKMIHLGRITKSRIISKGISAGRSSSTYRGLVSAHCQGRRRAQLHPVRQPADRQGLRRAYGALRRIRHCPRPSSEHEATTTRLSEDQLFYAMQRGLSQEEAVALLVNGFVREVLQELPMEFAVEAQKLVAISLEGSVG